MLININRFYHNKRACKIVLIIMSIVGCGEWKYLAEICKSVNLTSRICSVRFTPFGYGIIYFNAVKIAKGKELLGRIY